jgi:hypothetical protein
MSTSSFAKPSPLLARAPNHRKPATRSGRFALTEPEPPARLSFDNGMMNAGSN